MRDQTKLALSAAIAVRTLTLVAAVGFSFFDVVTAVQGSERLQEVPATAPSNVLGQSILLPNGHKMFVECSGGEHYGPTVILATGRGLGSYEAWALVQSRVASFARVCSYDPLGYGKSDPVGGDHPIDEVVGNMHDLFHGAHLKEPYILVGASLGGVLIRRYEQQYPSDVAGFVFVDSAHEEMEWRDARISTTFDASWNDAKYLRNNGLFAPNQSLAWRDDVPMIVLERTDLPPCAAFPGLNQSQCEAINQVWHDLQVDLSRRSKYAELRPIAGSGHAMQQQKPEAIAQAIHDVLDRLKATRADGSASRR